MERGAPTSQSHKQLKNKNRQRADRKSKQLLVVIRVRPLLPKEINQKDFTIVKTDGKLLIVLDPREVISERRNIKITNVLHRSKEQRYAYDKIFCDETPKQIYEQTCKKLIQPILKGYNACVFAYGPTVLTHFFPIFTFQGTGKTYTMLGSNQDNAPGLITLTINDIIDEINREKEQVYKVKVSYVEIYNENIKDLLVPMSNNYLELRDHPSKGIIIAGVTELKVESKQKILQLLQIGNRRRKTESTNVNKTSSRSHAVFQITVISAPKTKGYQFQTLEGKLSLIDLAGSERGTVTENRGIRLREGAKINTSLLSLANCINALGDKKKKGTFVPYRDSKLTRMLKDSLGGNSKTIMIANISPANSQIEETINTLKYASRAKNIKIKPIQNRRLVSLHIKEYKNIIQDLKHEITELKFQISNSEPQPSIELSIESIKENPEECPCYCGRKEEEIVMKKIQNELFANFQHRIQLRRAIMEVSEQNAENIVEIRKREAEISI